MTVVAVCLEKRGNAVNVGHPRTSGVDGPGEAHGDAGRLRGRLRQVMERYIFSATPHPFSLAAQNGLLEH